MSAVPTNFAKRGAPALSLNITPRPGFKIESISSNKENYPEASTPQLPKKTIFNSKSSLSVRKSTFSGHQCPQESEDREEISLDKASPLEIQKLTVLAEPKSALFRKKEAELSFCGDNSPSVVELSTPSPLLLPEKDYNEELYKKAEEYLDSLHFVVVLPEDHRRRPFGNLRVSTAKVPSSDCGTSEYNSPGLISPSIHTSSLFVRRSSSKKMDSDSTPAKQKLSLAKSPFYNCSEKGIRLFAGDSTANKEAFGDIDEDSAPERCVVTALNVRFTGMSLRASREHSETSSMTSFKAEEDSPLKIII